MLLLQRNGTVYSRNTFLEKSDFILLLMWTDE